MKALAGLGLLLMVTTASAEVFKCVDAKGRILYQATACAVTAQQKKLEIVVDPEMEAQALKQYQALQAEYDLNKAEKQQAEQKAAEQRLQNQQLQQLKQNALIQQQQVINQQKQLDLMESQSQQLPAPVIIMNPLPVKPRRPNLPEVNSEMPVKPQSD